MTEQNELRRLLLDYKLDRMQQPQRERLEERIFNDAEFSAMLEEAEYDLLDDYRAGRLSTNIRELVAQAFSPAELARTIRTPAQRVPRAAAIARRRGMFLPVFALSLSALLIAGVIFIARHAEVRSEAGRAESAAQAGDMATPPAAAGRHEEEPTLLLTAEVVRDGSAMHLRLAPAVRMVRVQWVVPAEASGSSFSLSVAAEHGVIRTTVESAGVSILDGQRVAEFSVPADVFRGLGDRYLLSVRSSGAAENPIREYRLTVARR